MTPTAYAQRLDARQTTISDLEPLELVHSHMPKWLLGATPQHMDALNTSMAQSRSYHGRVGKKFAQLQSIEAYCAALLSTAVRRKFGPLLDIHRDYLAVTHVHLITDDTLLATIRHYTVHDEPKTLLWAALQNFSADEATRGGFNPQSRILHRGYAGQVSPVKPHQFAALCRTLDLGLEYQAYLERFLGVKATGNQSGDATHLATESDLRLLKRYDMEVDAHIAFFKKNISETAYKALLSVLANSGVQRLDAKPVFQSSLSILDTVIDGVVIFSPDTLLLHPDNRLIAYIPNDPKSPFFEFRSLQVFVDELKQRLLDPDYAQFFSRFVALSARATFIQRVNAKPDYLGLTAAPLGMPAAHYLCAVQLRNMFADAQMLAVPTGVLDEREREQRWQLYKNVGLMLVNVAALFVPALGYMMLAVAIGEMLKEVYEGVEDWTQGDVDHAREHLLNVAWDVAINAAVVAGVVVAKKVVSRLSDATKSYFADFQPIRRDDGTVRLWDKNLQPYEQAGIAQHRHRADAQGFINHDGKSHVEVAGKHYSVELDGAYKQWRISHPTRPDAFRPALLHNREGAWQHVHEWPLEWDGSEALLGRLGAMTATLSEQRLEQIRALTDTPQGVMRRVHLENLAPPPLLKVSLKRFEIDQQLSTFIEQMTASEYNAPRWADLQMQLLPMLPGWPVGKGLTVEDATGYTLAQYGTAQWVASSNLHLTSAITDQGKLLEAVLAGLSSVQGKALLGRELSDAAAPARVLAQKLATYVQENWNSVFEHLYEGFNVSKVPEASAIEASFPGLPRAVSQAIVESASPRQRELLRTSKVPLDIAEQVRVLLREARINRALEGFYLQTPVSDDTEKLILHFFQQLPGWRLSSALEIREGSLTGPVTHRWGQAQPDATRVLVKTPKGYQRYAPSGQLLVLQADAEAPLSTAIYQSLTGLERQAMGLHPVGQTSELNAALGLLAVQARDESARILGMQPVKPRFRPPAVLADARVGYPLCGMRAGGHSSALRRRVSELYPEFDQDQVLDYLDGFIERREAPLQALRERKRERTALRNSLQFWIDAAPELGTKDAIHDYAENRYHAAGLIERIWRKSPSNVPWASSDDIHSLSLEGLRVGNLPQLPAVADFSHVRELKLSNMDCKDRANLFLEHFSGLTALEMDNNEMAHLPVQLELMPNLRRLSLARNLLYMTTSNASVLNALSSLEVLNLNDNLLGPLLSFNNHAHLRRVYLRRTWIQVWPEGLLSRPFLEAADLRENQILEIPEQVFQASPKIIRNITLSNNPLSPSSRLQLGRYVMQGGSSMGISSEELLSEMLAFEFWTAGITSNELSQRELLWNNLRANPASEDFFIVISRLTTTADAHTVRQDLSRRVWEMIEAASQNSQLRSDLLNIAASPRSCSDSVAVTFSAMEIQVLLAEISRGASFQQAQLLHLAKGLFRLDKLASIAAETCEERLAQGRATVDELEVNLAYRIGLSQTLELPGQPKSMSFRGLAGVTEADLDMARVEVQNAERSGSMAVFITTLEFWKTYMASTHKAEYTVLTEPYFEALHGLLRRSPEMNSARYLRNVAQVRNEMDAAVDAWNLEKTQALIAKDSPGEWSTAL